MDGPRRGSSFKSFIVGLLLGVIAPQLFIWGDVRNKTVENLTEFKRFLHSQNFWDFIQTPIDNKGRKYHIEFINSYSFEDHYQYQCKYKNEEPNPLEEIKIAHGLKNRLYHINLTNSFSLDDNSQFLYDHFNDETDPPVLFVPNTRKAFYNINLINSFALEDQYQYPSVTPEHYRPDKLEEVDNTKLIYNMELLAAHSLEDQYQYEYEYLNLPRIEKFANVESDSSELEPVDVYDSVNDTLIKGETYPYPYKL